MWKNIYAAQQKLLDTLHMVCVTNQTITDFVFRAASDPSASLPETDTDKTTGTHMVADGRWKL